MIFLRGLLAVACSALSIGCGAWNSARYANPIYLADHAGETGAVDSALLALHAGRGPCSLPFVSTKGWKSVRVKHIPVSLKVPRDYQYGAFPKGKSWPTPEGFGRPGSGRQVRVSLTPPQARMWPPVYPIDPARWCIFTSHGHAAVVHVSGGSSGPQGRNHYQSRWWLTPALWIEIAGEATDTAGYLEVLTILRTAKLGRTR